MHARMHVPTAETYDPIPTPHERPLRLPARPNRTKLALLLALAPVGGFLLCLLIGPHLDRWTALTVIMSATTFLALAGVAIALKTAVRLLRIDTAVRPRGLLGAGLSIGTGLITATIGAFTALITLMSFSRGRQLRRRGRPIFAPVDDRSPWVTPARTAPIDPVARPGIANAWRTNGLTEHASVAAFARLAIDLVALGAPPRLIRAAYADALDEMRHTELCFELARLLDGRALGPAAFPAISALPARRAPRPIALARLAVDSLIDGALNEGVSARVIAQLSRTTDHPQVQPVLAAIARDEARHAAHAFEVLRWCVLEGGFPVIAAVRAALFALPARPGAEIEGAAVEEAEAFGLPEHARIERAFRAVRARLVARTERLLAAAP